MFLPGKKGSQLGEYDPLTQADSEDESEEDDLVLNYPRNGLARAGCLGPGPSDPQGGRPHRLDHSEDEAEEEEEERKSMQYWNQREDGEGEGGGGSGGGAGGEGAGPSGSQAERKRKRERSAVRAAFFLVPLVVAMLMVLLCAFLIPCQKAEHQPQWERPVGEAGGNLSHLSERIAMQPGIRLISCIVIGPPRCHSASAGVMGCRR